MAPSDQGVGTLANNAACVRLTSPVERFGHAVLMLQSIHEALQLARGHGARGGRVGPFSRPDTSGGLSPAREGAAQVVALQNYVVILLVHGLAAEVGLVLNTYESLAAEVGEADGLRHVAAYRDLLAGQEAQALLQQWRLESATVASQQPERVEPLLVTWNDAAAPGGSRRATLAPHIAGDEARRRMEALAELARRRHTDGLPAPCKCIYQYLPY